MLLNNSYWQFLKLMQILLLRTLRPSKLNGGHQGSTSAASLSSCSLFFLSLSSFFLLFESDGPVFAADDAFVGAVCVPAAPFSGWLEV